MIKNKMKVIISVGGRWHAFDLAKQLIKRDALKFIITSYPKFATRKYSLPDEKVKSLGVIGVLERIYLKLPLIVKNLCNPQFYLAEIFDKLASKYLEKTDIFVGWATFSLHTLRKAKKMGSIVILEHGSAHPNYATRIIEEEYKKFGITKRNPFEVPDPRVIEKLLKEIEEADFICIPSSFVKRTYLENGVPENKLIQVPYGIDLSVFKPVQKTDNKFRIIFAGGIDLEKGVQYLLEAFKELKLPNSEILLLGKVASNMKNILGKYKNLNIKIKFAPHFKIYKEYSQGSVFVLPSLTEGLSRATIEAMACGLPVICTPNTGAEGIIREGIDGFIVPIRNVEKLKEKILYLYENPEACKQMGQNAMERVKTGFTWDDYGEKIYNTYLKILSKG